MADARQIKGGPSGARIRCAACGHEEEVRTPSPAECPRCGAEAVVSFHGDGRIESSPEVSKARMMAAEHGISLGFALGVIAGRTSLEAARAAGDRDAVARRVAEEHGVALLTAYCIADGKLSLAEVRPADPAAAAPEPIVEEQAPAAPAPEAPARRGVTLAEPAPRGGSRGVPILWLLIGLLLLAGGITIGSRRPSAPAPARTEPVRDAEEPSAGVDLAQAGETRMNEKGEVAYVQAGSPEAVLSYYCQASSAPGKARSSVKVIPVDESLARGVLEADGARYEIFIQRQPETGAWIAGDGRTLDLLPAAE